NTGASQREYDELHGDGAFLQLEVPDYATRKADPDAFLHPSAKHPDALGPFALVPQLDQPGHADLGLWNVFLNPDIPRPQGALKQLIAKSFGKGSKSQLLDRSLALFKTPSLRDLGQSGPYLHTGSFTSLADTMQFYEDEADLARAGQLRNGDI